MSRLFVSEYSDMEGLAGVAPARRDQCVVLTVGTSPSLPFSANTRIIRVSADVACSIVIGPAVGGVPVPATTFTARIGANNEPEYFKVRGGWFISAIPNT